MSLSGGINPSCKLAMDQFITASPVTSPLSASKFGKASRVSSHESFSPLRNQPLKGIIWLCELCIPNILPVYLISAGSFFSPTLCLCRTSGRRSDFQVAIAGDSWLSLSPHSWLQIDLSSLGLKLLCPDPSTSFIKCIFPCPMLQPLYQLLDRALYCKSC